MVVTFNVRWSLAGWWYLWTEAKRCVVS